MRVKTSCFDRRILRRKTQTKRAVAWVGAASLLVTFLLVFPADAASKRPPKERFSPAEKAAATRVISALDAKLIDYPSARFREVKFDDEPEVSMVCGYVNSKNRSGGYSGWAPFVVINRGTTMIGDDPGYARVVKGTCDDPGHQWRDKDFSELIAPK